MLSPPDELQHQDHVARLAQHITQWSLAALGQTHKLDLKRLTADHS